MRLRSVAALLAIAGSLACAGAQAASPAGSNAQNAPAAGGILLVANQQSASASIVDVATGTVTNVDVGEGPHEAVISSDGRWGVISVYGTQQPGNRLAVIDMTTKKLARHVDLGRYTRPHDMTFVPGSTTRVLVTSETTQSVVEVDIAGATVIRAMPTQGTTSHSLALSADGKTLFTANMRSDDASQVDVTAGTVVRVTKVATRPEGIAITPDGSEAWVGSNTEGTIRVIASGSGELRATIPGLGMPYRITISPNGKLAAVADPTGNRVHVIDVPGRKLLGSIDPAGSPRGLEITPDSRTVFITLGPENAVVAADLTTLTAGKRHGVGTAPDGVGWGPRR